MREVLKSMREFLRSMREVFKVNGRSFKVNARVFKVNARSFKVNARIDRQAHLSKSVQSVVSQGIGESLAYTNGVPMANPWRIHGVPT